MREQLHGRLRLSAHTRYTVAGAKDYSRDAYVADLDRDPRPSQGTKRSDHPSFRCRHLTFAKNLALLAQYAVATVSASQIHSNRDGLLRPPDLCHGFGFCRVLLRFFMAVSFALRVRMWELTASRASRPSHSISEVVPN